MEFYWYLACKCMSQNSGMVYHWIKEQRFPHLPDIINIAYLEYLCLPLSSNLIDPTVTHVQISLFFLYINTMHSLCIQLIIFQSKLPSIKYTKRQGHICVVKRAFNKDWRLYPSIQGYEPGNLFYISIYLDENKWTYNVSTGSLYNMLT